MSSDTVLLSLAVSLAERAGAEIRSIRDRGFQVQRKPDKSMVTEADHASEALILTGLRQALPDCTVVAEEAIAGGFVATASAEFWLVDPLDGTREFVDGGPDFAVNIGLVRDGRPILGAVGVPASGMTYSGLVGVGAWRHKDGHRSPISARQPPSQGLTVVASRYHGDQPRLDAFLAGRAVARVVNFGSSLKFCRVAEGEADLYPRFGRTMEWDTAGPQAVLEAAGGRLLDMAGAPLTYGKPGWENPHFLCCGR